MITIPGNTQPTPLAWPKGTYTLMKPFVGCPGSDVNWKEVTLQLLIKILQVDVRENRRGNEEWIIQRHLKHWAHKTQEEDRENTTH
jgi:hypothetical protein